MRDVQYVFGRKEGKLMSHPLCLEPKMYKMKQWKMKSKKVGIRLDRALFAKERDLDFIWSAVGGHWDILEKITCHYWSNEMDGTERWELGQQGQIKCYCNSPGKTWQAPEGEQFRWIWRAGDRGGTYNKEFKGFDVLDVWNTSLILAFPIFG